MRVHPPAWTRALRRFFRPFLSRAERRRLAAAILEAEKTTTAKIHVAVVARLGGQDPLAVARARFARHRLKHAVLILVSHLDHRFALYGDESVHSKAGQAAWDAAAAALGEDLKARRYAEGLEGCVRRLGAELSRHFPKA